MNERPSSNGSEAFVSPKSPELSPRSELEFAKKIVVITGVSKENGIGAAIAKAFAENGAEGILISSTENSREQGLAREAELRELGSKAIWKSADLSKEEAAVDLIRTAKDEFGRVDILVCNAGIMASKTPFPKMTVDEWDNIMDINLRAPFILAREAYNNGFPKGEGGGGCIVLIGSPTGEHGGDEKYASAKAGERGLNKSLAVNLGRRNIRSNMVSPGLVMTDIGNAVDDESREMLIAATPLEQLAKAQDVAYAVLFFASSQASMITGQELVVDGGIGGGFVAIPGLRREKYIKQKKEAKS